MTKSGSSSHLKETKIHFFALFLSEGKTSAHPWFWRKWDTVPKSFSLTRLLLCKTWRLGVLLLPSLPSVIFFFYTSGQGQYPGCTQLPFPSVASFVLLWFPLWKGNPTACSMGSCTLCTLLRVPSCSNPKASSNSLLSSPLSWHQKSATFANAGVQQVRFLHNMQGILELTNEN